jgi:GNAT superfamily N-acetyltransferase
MPIRVRAARLDDAPELAELTTQLGYPITDDELRPRLATLLADDASLVLVAVEEADRPIGWLHVMVHHSLESAASVRIGGLVVDGRYRSQSVGRRLLAAGEAWARERGVARMTLYSRQTRERAHRFYQREGYRIAKRSYMLDKDLI